LPSEELLQELLLVVTPLLRTKEGVKFKMFVAAAAAREKRFEGNKDEEGRE